MQITIINQPSKLATKSCVSLSEIRENGNLTIPASRDFELKQRTLAIQEAVQKCESRRCLSGE